MPDYQPNIPNANDDLSVSQGDLLDNAEALNTLFGINHVAFAPVSANAGKHNLASLVEQASDPESLAEEYLLYSKADAVSGDTELFARPPSNADAYQITKNGSIYTGLVPFAAVNFTNSGAIQGSTLNVTDPTGVSKLSGNSRYLITFTTPNADANYFWSVSGFDSSSNPLLAQVTNGVYSSVVKPESIQVQFQNQNGATVTSITAACVICWRIQ